MEALKTYETDAKSEGLVECKEGGNGSLFGGKFEKVKCVESKVAVPLAGSDGIESCKVNGVDRVDAKGISVFVELASGVTNKTDAKSSLFCDNNEVKVEVSQQEFNGRVIDKTDAKSSLLCDKHGKVSQQELNGGVVNKTDVKSSLLYDNQVKIEVTEQELNGGVIDKTDVKSSLLYDNQVKVEVSEQEYGGNVGDLVWATIYNKRSQLWWPGIVCDAANAPNEAANKPMREDDILVRCFGNRDFIWCSPYDVKPFVGYFDQLPNQSKAVKYLDALEKAVTELGHRVKTEFTCTCYSKTKMEKTGHFGDVSVTRFEPAMFLEFVKDLGRSISMPDKIEYVVKQNCLSAFYRSLGHLQIPMYKLKTEDENGYFDDIEKSCETRERRKSMYLSYPGERGIGTNGLSPLVKKPRNKWSRKNKAELANVSTFEVLSQLQFAAQDCLFQCECKELDSFQRFISGFREWAFKDGSSEVLVKLRKGKSVISPAFGNDMNHGSRILDFKNGYSFTETQSTANERTKWPANQGTVLNFGNLLPTQPSTKLPTQPSTKLPTQPPTKLTTQRPTKPPTEPPTQPPLRKLLPKRPKNIAENCTSMPTWNGDISTLRYANQMPVYYQAPPYHFPNGHGPVPPYFTVPNGSKRGRKRKNIDLQANPGSAIGSQANLGSSVGLKANSGSSIGLHANPDSMKGLQSNPGSTIGLQANPGSLPPCYTGNHSEPQASVVPNGLNHVPKKRGRKRKTVYLQANPGLIPPYYAGHHGEPQTGPGLTGLRYVPDKVGNLGSAIDLLANAFSTLDLHANPASTIDFQANPGLTVDLQANHCSTIIPSLKENITGQKKQKRVEKGKEVGIPCVDLSYNKVRQDDSELKGTAFLLKFSSEHPLPTIQDLNLVFSKYGELMETETQVLNANLSGQVVFLDSSSAGGAFWGLQNDKPLGSVLVNYKIQHLSGSESMVPFKTPIKSPSVAKPKDSKAIISPTVIPDLNTNLTEVQVSKRSKTVEEIRLPPNDNYLSYNKVHQGNEEATGTALLLKFSPNHSLPSIQDLNMAFCKYGKLNESETRISDQNYTGQVVFVNASTARDAIHRLEKDRPFGQALLSYRVHHLYSVQSAVQVKSPITVPLEMKPPQDLGVIKKNLKMMNVMLEKSGDSLSPEMRRKLESEIKGLMNKVTAIDGSSSSCL